jgi:hypothetical protein
MRTAPVRSASQAASCMLTAVYDAMGLSAEVHAHLLRNVRHGRAMCWIQMCVGGLILISLILDRLTVPSSSWVQSLVCTPHTYMHYTHLCTHLPVMQSLHLGCRALIPPAWPGQPRPSPARVRERCPPQIRGSVTVCVVTASAARASSQIRDSRLRDLTPQMPVVHLLAIPRTEVCAHCLCQGNPITHVAKRGDGEKRQRSLSASSAAGAD